jgi:two-component system sensor histidine kinase CpxA
MGVLNCTAEDILILCGYPIAFPEGGKGSIHILFASQGPPHPEGGFALGLAIIGLIIALLIIPVSRFITDRVKQLKQSALRIAEGDLSHRAAVQSKDEIGELAQAFNHMTDKLERMITSSKELTANVSHELRTPLTRIRIAQELLREKLEKGNFKEYERHLEDIREMSVNWIVSRAESLNYQGWIFTNRH